MKFSNKLLLISFMLIVYTVAVSADAANESFTTANEKPDNPSALELQDGYTGTGCTLGDHYDNYTDNTLTTHMRNATIRWGKNSDPNSDTITTFICISTDQAGVDALTKANESSNDNCDVLNLWSEDLSILDNQTGVLINNISAQAANMNYNFTSRPYFVALMNWDQTILSNNRSEIIFFNFSLVNQVPTAPSSWDTATHHGLSFTGGWTVSTDPDDGDAIDQCPADSIDTYSVEIGTSGAGSTEISNTNETSNSHSVSGLSWGACGGSTTSNTYNVRLVAYDGDGTNLHPHSSSVNYDTTFDVVNDVPETPTTFLLNDSATALLQHSPGPKVSWTGGTDTDGGDVIDHTFKAGTGGAGTSDLVNNAATGAITSSTFFGGTIPWGTVLNAGNFTNKTVWITITAYDDQDGCAHNSLTAVIQLTNHIPQAPDLLEKTTFYNQNPIFNWTTVTDLDGDVISYQVQVSDSAYALDDLHNETTILNYSSTTNNTIPFAADLSDNDWSNNTVYVEIFSRDDFNPNITTGIYQENAYLADYKPNILSFEITDQTTAYGNCTGSTCTLNPLAHSYIPLAFRLTLRDLEADCANITLPEVYLCLNSTGETGCGDDVNQNFTFTINSSVSSPEICVFTLDNNITGNHTGSIPFFIEPGNYKFRVNVTDRVGFTRTTDAEADGGWTYGTLAAVDYPDQVVLGGAEVFLGNWSSGNNQYDMTNWGNDILDMMWNTTYLGKAGNAVNWTPTGDDFMIDDDDTYNTEVGDKIPPINITDANKFFNWSTGLERCLNYECNFATLNETMPTYFHIRPPFGLTPGSYTGTLTYTVLTHSS